MHLATDQQSADAGSPTLDSYQLIDNAGSSSFDGGLHTDSASSSGLGSDLSLGRYNVARDRQMRAVRPPIRYGFLDLLSYALSSAVEVGGDEPLSYEEAVMSKHSKKWLAAIDFEMESLEKNKTWILVERP